MQAVEKAKIRHFTPSLDGIYQDQMIQETDQAHLEFSYAIGVKNNDFSDYINAHHH